MGHPEFMQQYAKMAARAGRRRRLRSAVRVAGSAAAIAAVAAGFVLAVGLV